MAGPPSNDDTRNDYKVKETRNPDRLSKKKFEFQLQGLLLVALDNACRETERTAGQLMKDLLEQYLKREGYLPGWYR